MEYMLVIYSPQEQPQDGASSEAWKEYTERLIGAGVMRSGAGLQGTDQSTTVRVRDGEALVTDGPFAETKEWLAGYYVIDVPDLDAALDWAKQIPNVGYGSVEVRPTLGM